MYRGSSSGLMRFCWNLQQFSSFMEKHFELWTTLNFQVRECTYFEHFHGSYRKKYQTSNNKTFFEWKKPLGQFSNNWKQSKYCNSRYQVMLLNSQNTPQKIKALKSEFSFQTQNHIWLKEDFFSKGKTYIHLTKRYLTYLILLYLASFMVYFDMIDYIIFKLTVFGLVHMINVILPSCGSLTNHF